MYQNSGQGPQNTQQLLPDVASCFGHAWRHLWKNFLELLLVVIISFLISIPTWGLSFAEKVGGHGAFYLVLFSITYIVLVQWPVEYGVAYAFLKAARGERMVVNDMFEVFGNYLNAVFAHLLVTFIVGIGLVFFIVPGIIFACKLIFVQYLVVDKKMESLEAIRESWRMTTGHAFTVFLIGFLAIFIVFLGLILLVVGIVPAIIWVELAFASLYYAVSARQQPDGMAIGG